MRSARWEGRHTVAAHAGPVYKWWDIFVGGGIGALLESNRATLALLVASLGVVLWSFTRVALPVVRVLLHWTELNSWADVADFRFLTTAAELAVDDRGLHLVQTAERYDRDLTGFMICAESAAGREVLAVAAPLALDCLPDLPEISDERLVGRVSILGPQDRRRAHGSRDSAQRGQRQILR